MKKNNQQQYQTQSQQQTHKQLSLSGGRKDFAFSFSQSDSLDAYLRKPRSRAYMEIFDAVDMLSATDEEIINKLKANMNPDTAEEFADMSDEELLEEIRASIQEEFRVISKEIQQQMYGVLAKCYIEGCDCHAISSVGVLLDHYEIDGPMPEELKKGRTLLKRFPMCRCIEVYEDCCRVIMDDSSVVKVCNYEI